MIRQFTSRAMLLARMLFATMVVVAISATGVGAQSRTHDETTARSVIMSLYTIQSMMEQQGAGLQAGGRVMTSFRAFLAPELIDEIASGSSGFRPLTGASQGSVEDYQLRMAADQPSDQIVIEAAVESEGTVRLISFALSKASGRPLIMRIWGDGWSFGEGGAGSAQHAPEKPAEQPGAQEQQALADADRDRSATGSAASMKLPFQDGFDGESLGTQWKVLGEERDQFVVDGGVIYQIATGGRNDFRNEDSKNIFQLTEAPNGDFDMTLRGVLETKTGKEGIWLGLYEDPSNFLAANLYVYTSGCGEYLSLRIVNRQPVAGAEKPLTSEFDDNLFDKGPILSRYCGAANREIGDAILEHLNKTGFSLTLSRRGLLNFARVDLDLPAFGDFPGGPFTATTHKVFRTTSAGKPAFMLGQFKRAGKGESVARFDHFSISAPRN